MAGIKVTKTVLKSGIWYAQAVREDGGDLPPKLSAWHREAPIRGLEVKPSKQNGTWEVRFNLSPELISDGVQTVLIRDEETGQTVETVTLLAGEALGADLRAEVDLLRAELDMLKRAFRRHCVETAG